VKALFSVLLTAAFALSVVGLLAGPAAAYDGYVACSNSDDVIPFEIIGHSLGTPIALPGTSPYPYDATMSPGGWEIWVPDASSDHVVVIDVMTDSIIQTIPVPEYPTSIVFTDDGSTALVSARDGDVVTLISTSDYSVSGTLDVLTGSGGTYDGPGNMALDPVSGNIYALDWYDDTLYEIDPDATTVLRSVDIGSSAWQLVVDPAGVYVYVTDRATDEVRVIDRATLTQVTTVPVGDDPWGIDVTVDGTRLVVACEDDSNVYVVDTSDWSTTTVALAAGADPRDVDIFDLEWEADQAFIAGGSITGTDAVYVVELDGNTLESTIPVGGNPNCVAVQPQMTSSFVGTQGDAVARRLELECHPNPFNPRTFITYRMPERGTVELAVYDIAGRRVAVLGRGLKSEGEHRATWSGLNDAGDPVSTGVYFVRLDALGISRAEKVVLLK